jgi:hypothetical protein
MGSNMPFPQNLPAQIRDFAADVKTALGGFFGKVRRWTAEKAAELHSRIQPLVDRLMERLPPEKRRLVLIATMGVCSGLVLILAISLMAGGESGEKHTAVAEAALARQGIIPPDDLFLPDEPDFIPGVMLGREQRTVWTAGDAESLWQDPLKNGEEPWRNRIEDAIDAIMESVP